MPRGIQNVDSLTLKVELHDGRSDGDSPLLFDFHPVGLSKVTGLPGFNGPSLANYAPEKKELFGNRRLPRVRVRNDGERPPLIHCFSKLFW